MTRNIGILLFDDVEELDAVGPWEVLAYWTLTFPEDGYAVSMLSRDGKPRRTPGNPVRPGAAGLRRGAVFRPWQSPPRLRQTVTTHE